CDPMLLQNVGNGTASQVVTEVGHGTENPAIAPTTIFVSQADYEVLDFLGGPWPPGSSLGTAVVLLGNKFALPGQQRVRGHKVGNVIQYSTADQFGFRRQTSTLIIGNPEAAGTELFSQDSILFA